MYEEIIGEIGAAQLVYYKSKIYIRSEKGNWRLVLTEYVDDPVDMESWFQKNK